MPGLRCVVLATILSAFSAVAAVSSPSETQAGWVEQFLHARKLCQTGQLKEAEQTYSNLIERLKGMNASPALLSRAYDELAVILKVSARFSEAENNYLRALNLMEGQDGHQGSRVGILLSHVGAFYIETGQLARAERYLLDSRDVLSGSGPVPLFCSASLLQNLAALSYQRGNYVEAEQRYRQAIDVLRKGNEEDKPQLAIVLGNLAHVLAMQGRPEEGTALLDEAASTFDGLPGQYLTSYYMVLVVNAGVRRDLGEMRTAETSCDLALRLGDQVLGTDNPKLAAGLDVCARVYKSRHRGKEAKQLAARSASLKIELAAHSTAGKTIDVSALMQQSAR
jgi:tetratricopeptide (TPR) repeat protein